MKGWIKLHAKFQEWEWYQDSKMVHLFIHLLLKANFRPRKWQGITIERGQLVAGRKKLSADLGISERSIRTCLERLKSTKEVTIKTTKLFSIITICKYDSYQLDEIESDQESDQASDQQTTTPKEVFILISYFLLSKNSLSNTSKREIKEKKYSEKDLRKKIGSAQLSALKKLISAENFIFVFPDLLIDFLEHRNSLKKAKMTNLAIIRIQKKWERFTEQEVRKAVDKSITAGWTDTWHDEKEFSSSEDKLAL